MNETDHVVTHRRTVNTINKPTIVKSCIFSLERKIIFNVNFHQARTFYTVLESTPK